MGIVGPGGSGGSPSGPAGGVLAGEYPNPVIAANAIVEAYLAAAIREKLFTVGGWTDLKGVLGEKVEQGARGIFARIEGSTIRFRGEFTIKTAAELKAGETVMTLPEALRPERVQEIVCQERSVHLLLGSEPVRGSNMYSGDQRKKIGQSRQSRFSEKLKGNTCHCLMMLLGRSHHTLDT